jgi:glycosyltransferase involved in cell wall biosynthesis
MQRPRVAFFTDSFHEVNGVAQTSRQYDAFARRSQNPFLRVNVGSADAWSTDGEVRTLELHRGPAAFPVEQDMKFDPFFMRYKDRVRQVLTDFRPDIVHITGPSDVGILGATLAHQLKIPVVASWHTNLHEFGARRLEKALGFLPRKPITGLAHAAESAMLTACAWYYRIGRVLLAPNQELIDMLRRRTGKPVFLMRRGIDTNLFHPAKRTRPVHDKKLIFGYVGRITAEKGVRVLRDVERALVAAGILDFEFQIVGHGSETEWLQQNMKRAVFPGVLKGDALAAAYANFDAFLFPSRTDTFGNVILETLASGVPAIVTDGGGPKFLVKDGSTGFVTSNDSEFAQAALRIALAPERLDSMRLNAREYALRQSWDSVFQDVYRAYECALAVPAPQLH